MALRSEFEDCLEFRIALHFVSYHTPYNLVQLAEIISEDVANEKYKCSQAQIQLVLPPVPRPLSSCATTPSHTDNDAVYAFLAIPSVIVPSASFTQSFGMIWNYHHSLSASALRRHTSCSHRREERVECEKLTVA